MAVRQEYYVGSIPKKAVAEQLKTHLSSFGEIVDLEFRLEKCDYCPTKVAYVTYAKPLDEKAFSDLNRKKFQEKRLFVASTATAKYFTPLLSIVVRYLNENVSEEDIYTYFEKFGPLECVQKPAHSYAYVSFVSNSSVVDAFKTQYRPLKGVDAYLVAVKRRISMFLEHRTPMLFASLVEKSDGLDLFYDPAAEIETTLLVTNIPRDTEEDDLLDFLGKFGKISDWEMQKSSTCVMTNIGYVTYQHPRMARMAYLSAPLCFQGVGLEVYNHKLRHNTTDSNRSIILKRTSVYLTDDEIFEKFSEFGPVEYIQRLDTVNYNTIVRLGSAKAAKDALSTTCIVGESVHIRSYTSKQYHLAMIVPPENSGIRHPKRERKEALLQQIIDTEDRRNLFQLQTEFNEQYFNPNLYCYRNEVQVWNFAPKCSLVQFREFFKKYGTVINHRILKPDASSSVGVAYISFDTKLEAKRVSNMNQTFMGSKRLLVLMADQKIVHDPDLCVRVGNLTEEIMDEDVYDRFNMIGSVKYVFRPLIREAIVCMVEERFVRQAKKVLCVGRFRVDVTPLQPPTPAYPMQGPVGGLWFSQPAALLPADHGLVAPAPAPVPHPGHTTMGMHGGSVTLGPAIGELGASPVVTMQPGAPNITPRMRGLMQAVEHTMIKSKNFTTLPMLDQFNVVHDIVNHCLNFPQFLKLKSDEKIRYLIAAKNGFKYTNLFTLFTYPEQLLMLSVVEAYYRSTIDQGSLGTAYDGKVAVEASSMGQPNSLVVSTAITQDVLLSSKGLGLTNANNSRDNAADTDGDDDDNILIPPAPSPPPIFIHSRSASPRSDDASAQSRSMVLNGAAQRLRESAGRKRTMTGDDGDQPVEPNSTAIQTEQQPGGKRKRKRSKADDNYIMDDTRVFVSNVPQEFNESNIKELFGKYGSIKFVVEQKSSTVGPGMNSKAFVIQYATNHQAIRALDMHLTILLGQLIRVDQYKKQYEERPGHAISVTCADKYSEVAIYETFRSCGEVRFVWTRLINGKETCIIDYKDTRTVSAALKITYLHSGGRCKAIKV